MVVKLADLYASVAFERSMRNAFYFPSATVVIFFLLNFCRPEAVTVIPGDYSLPKCYVVKMTATAQWTDRLAVAAPGYFCFLTAANKTLMCGELILNKC